MGTRRKGTGVFWRKILAVCLLSLVLAAAGGCAAAEEGETSSSTIAVTAGENTAEESEISASGMTEASAGESAAGERLPEEGSYYSREEVALYLHLYHHLPSNYMTKKEARALGWEGGPLEPYAPGMAIGGDFFGNYEGILPEDTSYHECDIDTKGKSRGAKRLVWSEEWDIYYTADHYETFELLYTDDND